MCEDHKIVDVEMYFTLDPRMQMRSSMPMQMLSSMLTGVEWGGQGLVHITGGGFPENIPRVLPAGLGVSISRSSWEVPPLFRWIQQVSPCCQ